MPSGIYSFFTGAFESSLCQDWLVSSVRSPGNYYNAPASSQCLAYGFSCLDFRPHISGLERSTYIDISLVFLVPRWLPWLSSSYLHMNTTKDARQGVTRISKASPYKLPLLIRAQPSFPEDPEVLDRFFFVSHYANLRFAPADTHYFETFLEHPKLCCSSWPPVR